MEETLKCYDVCKNGEIVYKYTKENKEKKEKKNKDNKQKEGGQE